MSRFAESMNLPTNVRLTALAALLAVGGCGDHATFRILDKPVVIDQERINLSLEYLRTRHGIDASTPWIRPTMVVVHWTAVPTLEDSYDVFRKTRLEGRADIHAASTLNVTAQFLVDRDGTIFRLTPDTLFARHTIGLNHTAIGIENVGSQREPLTRAQLRANEALIRYLARRHDIRYLIGHHEYHRFRGSHLWLETDPDYITQKIDPGPAFMKRLRDRLQDLDLKDHP
jgi:N-acetyl-anhydromuramyl-L-alanine amidase AmpD